MHPAYRQPNVFWLLVMAAFFSAGLSMMLFAAIWVVYALGGTNSDLGLVSGGALLFSIVGGGVGSVMADRWRGDVVVWLSIGITAAGVVVMALATNLWVVFIGESLGLAGLNSTVAGSAGMSANSIRAGDRNRVYATQYFVITAGRAAGNLILALIFWGTGVDDIPLHLVRLGLWLGAAFLGIALLTSLPLRDRLVLAKEEEGSVATETEVVEEQSRFAPFSRRTVLLVLGAYIFFGVGTGLTATYVPRFLFDVYELDLGLISLLFAGVTAATGIWSKILGWLADRRGRIQVIIGNQILAGVMFLLLATEPWLILALFIVILGTATLTGPLPVADAVQMEYTRRHFRSQLKAIQTVLFALMFGVGQVLGGFVVDGPGFAVVFALTAGLYLASIGLFESVRRDVRSLGEPRPAE